MANQKVFALKLSRVYPLLVQKAERKGRTKDEVNQVICWLCGYDEAGIRAQLERDVDYKTFFDEAPRMNPLASRVTGKVCGVRVEDIEDPTMRAIRQLDKLVDELAKGRTMSGFFAGRMATPLAGKCRGGSVGRAQSAGRLADGGEGRGPRPLA